MSLSFSVNVLGSSFCLWPSVPRGAAVVVVLSYLAWSDAGDPGTLSVQPPSFLLSNQACTRWSACPSDRRTSSCRPAVSLLSRKNSEDAGYSNGQDCQRNTNNVISIMKVVKSAALRCYWRTHDLRVVQLSAEDPTTDRLIYPHSIWSL